MFSSLWFKRAKAGLALLDWLENLHLAAGIGLDVAVDSYQRWDPAEVAIGRRLLAEYRRLTPDNFTPAAAARAERELGRLKILKRELRARTARERRARTDDGRETDAGAAVPAKPW
jgi:hypothetical protein